MQLSCGALTARDGVQAIPAFSRSSSCFSPYPSAEEPELMFNPLVFLPRNLAGQQDTPKLSNC